MKHLGHSIFAAVLVIIAASCSSIPNKSVFESLDTKELAKAIKSDELFERVYEDYSKAASCFNEIEKAKYSDITWRKIYKAVDSNVDFPQIVIEKGATKRGIQR